MKMKDCPKCHGLAWRRIPGGPDPFGNPSYFWGECPDCYGKGKVEDKTPEQEREDREDMDTIRREYGLM